MITCLTCGTTNPPTAMICLSCKSSLKRMPVGGSTSSVPGGRITERYEMFKDIVSRVKMGEMSSEELLAWLLPAYEIMNERANNYVTYMEESGYFEYQNDEVDQSFSGIEDYDSGVQQFFLYCEDGNLAHLDEGLHLIWDGNEKINEAMRLNRQFRKGLEDDWGYE